LSYAKVVFPPAGSTTNLNRPAVVYPYRVVLPSGSVVMSVRPITFVYVYDVVSPSGSTVLVSWPRSSYTDSVGCFLPGSKVFRSRSRLSYAYRVVKSEALAPGRLPRGSVFETSRPTLSYPYVVFSPIGVVTETRSPAAS